ncbi:MAG: branched-chain amino acid aminotransferase [Candidatus Dadabacteria bacterium]|nr:MAG: branched-chain amino acid aminotransferase [Candidatus Dadabacteria bacterium]
MPLYSIDGEILPKHAACLPVDDHGLLYGDGVFEGIRFYTGRPFRLEAHLARLERSATAIGLCARPSLAEIRASILDAIAASALTDGYVRVLLTRGSGPLGIDPSVCTTTRLIVIVDTIAIVSDSARSRGLTATITPVQRVSARALDPRIKSLNYLNQIQARRYATAHGCDEAILLNEHGLVAEGSADNVFVVRDGRLLTPPVQDGALDGITRAAILELARHLDITTGVESLMPYDLYTATECFLTGTAIELVPVACIDGQDLPACPGPVFCSLQNAFQSLIRQECAHA